MYIKGVHQQILQVTGYIGLKACRYKMKCVVISVIELQYKIYKSYIEMMLHIYWI